MADNACNNGFGGTLRSALHGDIRYEYGFANGFQMIRTSFTVVGTAFNKDCLFNLVSRFGVAP